METKMEFSAIRYKGQNRIKVSFPYEQAMVQTVKKIPGAQWSNTLKAWHFPNTQESVDLLQKHFGCNAYGELVTKKQLRFDATTLKTQIGEIQLPEETLEKLKFVKSDLCLRVTPE